MDFCIKVAPNGTWAYAAGITSATPTTITIPVGSSLMSVRINNGPYTIFGGSSIAGSATPLVFPHGLAMAGDNSVTAGSQDIVITGAGISYFIEYITP